VSAVARQLTVNVRSARGAAERRRKRSGSLRYRSIINMLMILGVFTVGVVFYLGLLANVTRLTYEQSHLDRTHARLVDDAARLDDQIAKLESRDRLAVIAARLGMRESRRFDVAVVPSTRAEIVAQQRARNLVVVPPIASWLR
jgi:hypothetical protein